MLNDMEKNIIIELLLNEINWIEDVSDMNELEKKDEVMKYEELITKVKKL